MSLIQNLLQAVRSWRRGGSRKATKRAGVTVERLDHRQLLSVSFSGNITTDFPSPTGPGVAVLTANPGAPDFDQLARPNPNLINEIKVSGFRIDAMWVSYDPRRDVLSVGLQQPDNQKNGRPVLSGDADNSGNAGNPYILVPPAVDKAVLDKEPDFIDYADLAGSERMGAFLDLTGNGTPDIVAGVSNDLGTPKGYQVADAVLVGGEAGVAFGPLRPVNTGNYYLVNDPRHPNFEFEIAEFSDLYLEKTGKTLNANSVIGIGAFGGSGADFASSQTFINLKPFTLSQVTQPDPCPPCPPLEPGIQINPHLDRHVNTAHPTDVKVYVFGSARFDVNEIASETVRLGGAAPILESSPSNINRDPYPDKVFIFRGSDLNLDPGLVDAVVTGELQDGQEFESIYPVFVKTGANSCPAGEIAQRIRRARLGPAAELTPTQRTLIHNGQLDFREAIDSVPSNAQVARFSRASENLLNGPVVRIPMRPAVQGQQDLGSNSTVRIAFRPGGRPGVIPQRIKVTVPESLAR